MVPNGTLYGFYRALVIDAHDPNKEGRVKIRIPDLMVDKGWGTGSWCDNGIWARPANNWIGGRNTYDTKGARCSYEDAWYQGSCMPPPKGTHVFVFFEKGDPSHPFYFAAADYGQTKVLPENRFGAQWEKKWTPIKTHEGRAIVFSDDVSDERVEITGKKRLMKSLKSTPDGDTKSVFKIDGNMTTFMIDERPDHEKVFLKDYRGNYIKMIQNEAGRNDQLHVYFKDDIHIETPKNIFIKAGENIHVTADQNMYITVGQDLYVNVAKMFKETANDINRWAWNNDYRFAGNNIHETAQNDMARNAANNIKDMAGSACSRSSAGIITDGASAGFSLQAGGVMSVLGSGGTMIDGPTVTIENGSAPIAPLMGIEFPATAPKATPPTPDKNRYLEPDDDGLGLKEAPEENPQYKPHASFWKPNYIWDKITQPDNSMVTASGPTSGKPTPVGGGGGGGGGSSSSPSTDSVSSSSSPSTDSVSSSSNARDVADNGSQQKSIVDAVKDCLKNNPIPLTPEDCMNISSEVLNNASDTISDTLGNLIDSAVNDINAKINDIDNTTESNLKNRGMLMVQKAISNVPSDIVAKCINPDLIGTPQMAQVISNNIETYFNGYGTAFTSVLLDVKPAYVAASINDFNKCAGAGYDIDGTMDDFYNGFISGFCGSIGIVNPRNIIPAVLTSIQESLSKGIPKVEIPTIVAKDITPIVQDINDDIILDVDPVAIIISEYESKLVPVYSAQTRNNVINTVVVLDTDQLIYDIEDDLTTLNNVGTTNTFSSLPIEILNKILSTIPVVNDIIPYVDKGMIDDYCDKCCKYVPTPAHIGAGISSKYLGVVGHYKKDIDSYLMGTDFNALMKDYSDLILWDAKQEIKYYLTNGVVKLINDIMYIIKDELRGILFDSLLFKNNIDVVPDVLINGVTYNILNYVKSYINNLNDGTSGIISTYLQPLTMSTPCYRLYSSSCINEFVYQMGGLNEHLIEDISYDYNSYVNTHKSSCYEQLRNCTSCNTNNMKLKMDLNNSVSDILNPIENITDYNDFIRNDFTNRLIPYLLVSNVINEAVAQKCCCDVSPYDEEKAIGTVNTVVSDIMEDLNSNIAYRIQNDFISKKEESINRITEMMETKNPKDWNTDEIIESGKLLNDIYSYYDNFENTDTLTQLFTDTNVVNTVETTVVDDVDGFVPTKENYSENINECVKETCNALSNYIKTKISDNINVTENIEDNKFSKDVDLTALYTIPGVEASKHHCECCEKEDVDPVWCDPEIVGGCGCIYEYTLFLKHKFYNTLIPILYNDSIKTFGFSLHPNLNTEKINDNFECLHDIEIKQDYEDLVNKIYNDEPYDENENKYINRIDEIMATVDRFDITCIINLMDFENTNYIWLNKEKPLLNYTHDMVDEHFVKLMSTIIKHIFYKDGVRRTCRIVLNIGNRSYKNPADENNDIFNCYPNCGFIRDLIMKLAYECNVSSNYMSITSNENNNLYYYNPYTQFKSYDDDKLHILEDYDVCIRDCVDEVKNGMNDIITYNEDGEIDGGYANYYIKCSPKSYVMSYIYDLNEWLQKSVDGTTKTILEKYTNPTTGEVDSNIMNEIYSPNARNAMRYFYKGHSKYFSYTDLVFDPDTGDVEG